MHSIELLAGLPDKKLITAGAENIRLLEPYERIDPRAFTSLDVVLPKLYFAAQEGAHRLWQDKAFLIFWLLLIGGFKLLIIRSYLRKN